MGPLYILLPLVATRWTSGGSPLDLAMGVYPARVAVVPAITVLAYYTPAAMTPTPFGFYALIMLIGATGAMTSEFIFVAQMAFFARVSDPAMGGTYMTLLNTLGNLGGKWPPTLAFYLVDATTCKHEQCLMQADGFYVVAALCTAVGLAWFAFGAPFVRRMQQLKLEEWKVK